MNGKGDLMKRRQVTNKTRIFRLGFLQPTNLRGPATFPCGESSLGRVCGTWRNDGRVNDGRVFVFWDKARLKPLFQDNFYIAEMQTALRSLKKYALRAPYPRHLLEVLFSENEQILKNLDSERRNVS